MSKLLEFLLNEGANEEVTKEVDISGFPFPFVVKSISEKENKAIRKSCQHTVFDKKTRQKTTELDSDLYNAKLVVACCVEPNFKDSQLQGKYGVMGAESLVDTLLKPGQFLDLFMAVQEVNGFNDDTSSLMDEAKNS